jgi:hypothetical protein
MPTEAQKKATKKWVENHRETNIKRISECIQRRYQTDEDFRNKKRETERERQRIKREQKKVEAEAEVQAQAPVVLDPIPQNPRSGFQPSVIYGF